MIGDQPVGEHGGWSDSDWRDALEDAWDAFTDVVDDVLDAVWGWVETVVEIVRWVRAIVTEIYGVPMERWMTHGDERTCPECGAKDGAIFETGSGETPPLHTNCRCARVFAFMDWRTREVAVWQRQVETVVSGAWMVTGWA